MTKMVRTQGWPVIGHSDCELGAVTYAIGHVGLRFDTPFRGPRPSGEDGKSVWRRRSCFKLTINRFPYSSPFDGSETRALVFPKQQDVQNCGKIRGANQLS